MYWWDLDDDGYGDIDDNDVLGIMVISRSLAMVHHAMYDHFEHTHAFIYIHTGLGKVSFMLNDQFIEW